MAFLENFNFDWYKNECFWQRITCTDNFDIGCQHHLGNRSSTPIQDLRRILLDYLRFLLAITCTMPETAININRKIPIKISQPIFLCWMSYFHPINSTTAVLNQITKGQLNSEWIHEVIVSPKMQTETYKDFCPTKQTRIAAL